MNLLECIEAMEAATADLSVQDEKQPIWVGIDFDGTLVKTLPGPGIGKPISRMVKVVKYWLKNGVKVDNHSEVVHNFKVFSARAGIPEQREVLKAWTKKYLGKELEVTNVKDRKCIRIVDNISIHVTKDKGNIHDDYHEHDRSNDYEAGGPGISRHNAITGKGNEEDPLGDMRKEIAKNIRAKPKHHRSQEEKDLLDIYRRHGVIPPDKNIQAKAYKLAGKTEYRGLPISIETKKGQVRKGIGSDGKPWKVVMPYDYGYIRGTEGADGQHVDCFIGPNEKADNVYVVHQSKEGSPDVYDEDKVMLGFDSPEEAKKAYKSAYNGVNLFKGMHTFNFEDFVEAVNLKKNRGHALECSLMYILQATANEIKTRCPKCGSSKYALMPTDFETAKCKECGKVWDMKAGGPGSGVYDHKKVDHHIEMRDMHRKALRNVGKFHGIDKEEHQMVPRLWKNLKEAHKEAMDAHSRAAEAVQDNHPHASGISNKADKLSDRVEETAKRLGAPGKSSDMEKKADELNKAREKKAEEFKDRPQAAPKEPKGFREDKIAQRTRTQEMRIKPTRVVRPPVGPAGFPTKSMKSAGTKEGAEKAWDTRGRGRKEKPQGPGRQPAQAQPAPKGRQPAAEQTPGGTVVSKKGKEVSTDRQAAALKNPVRIALKEQQLAESVVQQMVAKAIGGKVWGNNSETFDVLVKKGGIGSLAEAFKKDGRQLHGIEVKAIINQQASAREAAGKLPQVSMKRSAVELKNNFSKENNAPMHTVIVDIRQSLKNPTVYFAHGVKNHSFSADPSQEHRASAKRVEGGLKGLNALLYGRKGQVIHSQAETQFSEVFGHAYGSNASDVFEYDVDLSPGFYVGQ